MNDVALEEAENWGRKQRQMEACLEAAQLITAGMPRAQAVRTVSDRISDRDDAIRSGAFVADAHGDVEAFLSTALDGDPLRYKNPAQVKAIALELVSSGAFARAD